jgi:hypothetical protein
MARAKRAYHRRAEVSTMSRGMRICSNTAKKSFAEPFVCLRSTPTKHARYLHGAWRRSRYPQAKLNRLIDTTET